MRRVFSRCGKEVKYVIDYYSFDVKNPHDAAGSPVTMYSLDARPSPGSVGGVWDRMRVAFQSWKDGEDWW